MNSLILGLGGNKGNVLDTFKKVEKLIKNKVGDISKSSSNYKTAAWGNTNQPDFLNKVIVVDTLLDVNKCLDTVLDIEQQLGRIRTAKKWQERTIDIDVLFYNDVIIDSEHLVVPHPYIQDRKFVLIPLVEILPQFIHPKLNQNLSDLLVKCNDRLNIKKVLKC